MTRARFVSALTTEEWIEDGLSDLVSQVMGQFGTLTIHALFVFFSPHFISHAQVIVQQLRALLRPTLLLGCSAEAVVGGIQEIENKPAIAVIAAHLPDATLTPFHIHLHQWREVTGMPIAVREFLQFPADLKGILLMADPFSTPMEGILNDFHATYGGIPVMGGMASGASRPNMNRLLLDGQLHTQGVIGVALSGAVEVATVVSQGCRPIGMPHQVTAAHDNVVETLDGVPALTQLQKLFEHLTERDQALIQRGLFLGRAIAGDDAPGRGDFLIRGVMGADPKNGALAIGDYVNVGDIVQFHVRDADTAAEDLELMLLPHTLDEPPAGALLFTCNGRGTNLFDHPHGDISLLQGAFENLSVAGFFCAGEIGMVGERAFLHSHTASVVLFY